MGVPGSFLVAQDDGPTHVPSRISGPAGGRVRPASAVAALRIPAVHASAFASSGVAVGSALLVWAVWTVPLGLRRTPASLSFSLLLSFAAEYTYRQWHFRRCLGAPTDFPSRSVLPPRA